MWQSLMTIGEGSIQVTSEIIRENKKFSYRRETARQYERLSRLAN